MAPKVTLQTIADALGVSRTTVSNAYSRPDQLSGELRERIVQTATRLGYRGPNPAGRTLRSGRAGAIGVVLTESLAWAFADPYAVGFLAAFAAVAETTRHAVLLVPCPPGEDQSDGIRNAVVDGFCVFTLPDEHPIVDEVLCRQLPTVFVDGPLVEGRAFVGIDDRVAMAELTRHLLGLGHRCFGVLAFRLRPDGWTGPPDEARIASADFRVTRERLGGILETTAGAGVPRDAVQVYEVGVNTRETARRAACVMLARPDRPTAIVCLSDQIALGVLDAVDGLGLQVPGDVSVTGFDDIAAAGPAGLTTVRQPAVSKGREAGQLLLAGAPEQIVELDHELVLRATTGPARISV
jgi:DNA-binding LacI/PurR family transcriptional regulator